jgi:hypothetical protein
MIVSLLAAPRSRPQTRTAPISSHQLAPITARPPESQHRSTCRQHPHCESLPLTASKIPGSLRAFYQRVRARRGTQIAIVATARKLVYLCWTMIERGEARAASQQSRRDHRQRARTGRPDSNTSHVPRSNTSSGYFLALARPETSSSARHNPAPKPPSNPGMAHSAKTNPHHHKRGAGNQPTPDPQQQIKQATQPERSGFSLDIPQIFQIIRFNLELGFERRFVFTAE